MNSFGNIFGSGGGGGPETGNWNGTGICTDRYGDRYGRPDGIDSRIPDNKLIRFLVTMVDMLFCCCRGRGVLTKFPSRHVGSLLNLADPFLCSGLASFLL